MPPGRCGFQKIQVKNRMNEFPEDSIFSTLKERPDLCFDGHQVKEDSNMPVHIETENGVRAFHHNDHVELYRVEGEIAGVIVADYSARNTNVDHPFEYLPHLLAIFVREEYRGRGIASQLIHMFMQDVERDRIVADYRDSVEPFYDQLDCKVIDL